MKVSGQRVLASLFVVLAAACLPAWVAAPQARAEAAKKPAAPPRMAGLPVPLPIADVVTITGGNIEKIHFQPGDEVIEGEAIVEIDTDRHRYNYEMAKLNYENTGMLDSAEAEVAVRTAELEKAKEDNRRRRNSDDDLRRGEAMLGMAEGKRKAAENQQKAQKLAMDFAENELEKRILRAPVSGIIISISKGLGQRANPGEVVILIGDPFKTKVSFPVAADVAALLQPGQILLMRSAANSLLYEAQVLGVNTDPKTGAKTADVAVQPSSGLMPVRVPDGEFTLDPDSLNPN